MLLKRILWFSIFVMGSNAFADYEGVGKFAGQELGFKREIGEQSRALVQQSRKQGNLREASEGLIRDDSPPFQEKAIYHLDPDKIYALAQESIRDAENLRWNDRHLLADVGARISEEYPFLEPHAQWTINNNYGVSGNLKILYSTRREYLILYGTGMSSVKGQTGRFQMDIRTVILRGEQFSQHERSPQEVHAHYTGDRAYLARGAQKTYVLNGWILEYGRGSLWSTFPLIFKANEGQNRKEQLKQSIKMSLRELFFGV
jgi:hypothetical protein